MIWRVHREAQTGRRLRSAFLRIFCFVPLTICAQAAQHPVPLDKNVDPAKCAECHADKSKGKHVHSAIAMGCTTCHEVATAKGVLLIFLTSPESGRPAAPAVPDRTLIHDRFGWLKPSTVGQTMEVDESDLAEKLF